MSTPASWRSDYPVPFHPEPFATALFPVAVDPRPRNPGEVARDLHVADAGPVSHAAQFRQERFHPRRLRGNQAARRRVARFGVFTVTSRMEHRHLGCAGGWNRIEPSSASKDWSMSASTPSIESQIGHTFSS